MRVCTGILALLFLASISARAEEQKRLLIINLTPFELLEVHVWYAPPGARAEHIPYRGDAAEDDQVGMNDMAPKTSITAYIAAGACVLQLTAEGEGGHLFSTTKDVCRTPSVWIIRSTSSL